MRVSAARRPSLSTVLMLWDANAARDEVSTESVQPLAARKWNPKGEHMEGAWRYANGDDNE